MQAFRLVLRGIQRRAASHGRLDCRTLGKFRHFRRQNRVIRLGANAACACVFSFWIIHLLVRELLPRWLVQIKSLCSSKKICETTPKERPHLIREIRAILLPAFERYIGQTQLKQHCLKKFTSFVCENKTGSNFSRWTNFQPIHKFSARARPIYRWSWI